MQKRNKAKKKQCKIDYEKLIDRLTSDGRLAKSSRVKERFQEKLNGFRKLKESDRYVLLCFAGMERLTVKDVRRCLGDKCLVVFSLSDPESVMPGHAGVGKVLVATEPGCDRTLFRVPSVQRLLIFIGCAGASEKVADPTFSKSEMTKSLTTFLENIDCWNVARKLRHRIRADNDETLTFRASVIRDGPRKHSLRSKDIACLVGDAASKNFPTWSVNLETYDVEIAMLVYDESVVIGMSVFDSKTCDRTLGTSYREWNQDVSEGHTACLKPSVAASLVQYADLKPNSVVLDCMSGVGTIPIEVSELGRHVFSLGGEIDAEIAVPQACKNVLHYQSWVAKKKGLAPDLHVWDVTRIPLRSSVVDVVIVDLPFGMRCSSASILKKLYPKAFAEMARIVRPQGRAVLMTTLRRQLLLNISKSPYWKIAGLRDVNMGGTVATVLLADRTDYVYV